MLMPEEVGTEALAQEKYLVKNAKKIAVLAAGMAAQRYGAKLDQEQEVLVNIANIANQSITQWSQLLFVQKKQLIVMALKKQIKNCYTHKSSAKKHLQKSKKKQKIQLLLQ